MRETRVVTFTIAASGTQSGAINTGGGAFGSLEVPSAITGATFTVEGRHETDGTWLAITDSDGAAVTITLAASKLVRFPDAAFPCQQLRIVSDQTEASERSFKLYLQD